MEKKKGDGHGVDTGRPRKNCPAPELERIVRSTYENPGGRSFRKKEGKPEEGKEE